MDPLDPRTAALLTDLYKVVTAAVYLREEKNLRATFELSFRELPPNRAVLVTAGLDQAVDYLRALNFTEDQLVWLKTLFVFKDIDPAFWDYLAEFRFTGDLWAIAEGTPVFAGEPVLRVTAPLIEAQLVETYVLSTVGFQTLVATKAARLAAAAAGRPVVDFGARRAQGPGASLLAARAAYLAGVAGTSNLEAAWSLGIPIYGDAGHSLVQSFPTEREAFEACLRSFPASSVIVLDTRDTLAAAHTVSAMGREFRAVRIESGDLGRLASEVREILDEGGLKRVKIYATGDDLDERRVAELTNSGAPIDLFGVGAELVTSRDAPSLDGVYELVELEERGERTPRMRGPEGVETWPGRKQVFRSFDTEGRLQQDVVGLEHEGLEGLPLLRPALREGELVFDKPGLETIRLRTAKALGTVPSELLLADRPPAHPVQPSPALEALRKSTLDGWRAGAAP